MEPAHWSPGVLGTTIICQRRTSLILGKPPWSKVRTHNCSCTDGEHSILQIGSARFRLWVQRNSQSDAAIFVLPDDGFVLLRTEAMRDFLVALWGRKRRAANPLLAPTAYQRQRLARLLTILDARLAGASTHEIAFSQIFPKMRPLKGATWKGSSERRHTLRLMAEARRLASTGYRQVLSHIPPHCRLS